MVFLSWSISKPYAGVYFLEDSWDQNHETDCVDSCDEESNNMMESTIVFDDKIAAQIMLIKEAKPSVPEL